MITLLRRLPSLHVDMADEEQTSSSRVKPLGVKRGMLKKSIPGVPFGQMFKGCGNVAHREDPERIKVRTCCIYEACLANC